MWCSFHKLKNKKNTIKNNLSNILHYLSLLKYRFNFINIHGE